MNKTLLQVRLQNPGEPLHIPYPPDFSGYKAPENEDLTEFYLSGEPRLLSVAEYHTAVAFMGALPYEQAIVKTGLVLWGDSDPILGFTHGEINQLESILGFPSSQSGPGGGARGLAERAILIRDRGYVGDNAAIAAALASGVANQQDFV